MLTFTYIKESDDLTIIQTEYQRSWIFAKITITQPRWFHTDMMADLIGRSVTTAIQNAYATVPPTIDEHDAAERHHEVESKGTT